MQEYLNKWSYKRLIQLGFGVYFFWECIQNFSIFALLFALLMSFQAIFNVGCFSTQGCNPNIELSKKDDFSENDEIDFEEVK